MDSTSLQETSAVRELIVTAKLRILDFRDDPPTDEEIAKYLAIFPETESRESAWWLIEATPISTEIR